MRSGKYFFGALWFILLLINNSAFAQSSAKSSPDSPLMSLVDAELTLYILALPELGQSLCCSPSLTDSEIDDFMLENIAEATNAVQIQPDVVAYYRLFWPRLKIICKLHSTAMC